MPNICIVPILSSCLQSIAAAMAVIINIICKTDDRAILFSSAHLFSTSITWLKAFCNKCKIKLWVNAHSSDGSLYIIYFIALLKRTF